MTTSIEMEDLRTFKAPVPQSSNAKNGELPPDDIDSSVAVWAWASASLLTLLAMPLLFFPRFLMFLATPAVEVEMDKRITSLERFLSAQFGMLLVAISVTLVLYIPSAAPVQLENQRRRDALGHPLLGPLTGGSLLASFVSYNTTTVGSLAFLFFLAMGVIGVWGMWVALFEGSSSISKTTGADKRTSAFLFGNKSAASVQKKEWKRAQSESKSR